MSDSATPWIAARQASLSSTNSQSSLRLTSIESVMLSSHLILCRPLHGWTLKIMLSEVSHTQKQHCKYASTLHEAPRAVKCIEAKWNRGSQGLGKARKERCYEMSMVFWVGTMKTFQLQTVCDSYTTLWRYLLPLNCILTVLNVIFYHNKKYLKPHYTYYWSPHPDTVSNIIRFLKAAWIEEGSFSAFWLCCTSLWQTNYLAKIY